MAVFWVADNKRSATLARKRVIGTRFSTRSPTAKLKGALAGAAGVATWLATSSLVIRPPLPVPVIWLGSSCFSATALRTEGAKSL